MNTIQETKPYRDIAGRKAGITGFFGNLLLALIKFAPGHFSNSIAVTADAFNNLTDCASCLVTIAGFTMASKEKDQTHPYGHGRMEYICGFMISNLILITVFTVGKDSAARLIHPEEIQVSGTVTLTLAAGILGKLFMAWYVDRLNKPISSPALEAVKHDDLSDSLASAVTLAGILLEQKIRDMLSEYPLFQSVGVITLHDYGPEEKVAFIKVAFQQSPHSAKAAKTMEQVKRRLREELQVDATLYWGAADESLLKENCS